MAKFILVGTSSAKAGQEAEYYKWYENDHVPAILSIPGVKSARRFQATPLSPQPNPGQLLGIFEIEADNPQMILAELQRRVTAGEMSQTDTLDKSSVQLCIWEEL